MAKPQPFDVGPDFELDPSISETESVETFYVTSEADLKNLPPNVRQMFEQAREAAGRSGTIRLSGDARPPIDVDVVQRAQMIIDAVRQAEETGQWDMARGFMSPRLFKRWQPWAQGMLSNRPATPWSMSREITPADRQSQATHDSVIMRVTESSPSTSPITTMWVFLRNASARNPQADQVFAGVCTNCGAPVDPMQTSTCRYCGAGVINLGPEWLLDDIRPDPQPR